MSLYTAETRRLSKRRFVRILLIGVLLVLAASAVGTYLTNHRIGPSEIAAAKQAAEQDYQENVRNTASFRADCEKAKANPATSKDTSFPENCADITPAGPESFDWKWHLPSTFKFKDDFTAMLVAFAALMTIAAFLIGASFAGAEWSSGGVSNLLLWRPQRIRVLLTKLAALLVWLTVVTVVATQAWIGTFWFIAKRRGELTGMTPGAWRSTELAGLRALVLVLVAAAAGFALATIGRHTAVALGVAVGGVVVLQFGLGTVLSLAHVKFAEAYLAPFWVIAWLRKSYKITDYNHCDITPTEPCKPPEFLLTYPSAGYGLAVIFVVLVGVALWSFRKRDIT